MKGSLPKSLWPFIWHFLSVYRPFVFCMIALAMITGLWGPFNSILIKHIVNILGSTQLDEVTSAIIWPAVLFVLNFEIHNLCWRGMAYLNYKYQPVIKNHIVSETFGYVLNHTHQFFQDNLSGRISNRVTTLADNIERIVHDISRHLFRFSVLIVVAFISMYTVHPKFCAALMVWFILFTCYSLSRSRRLIDLAEIHADAESAVTGQLVDSITNSSNVRMFARRKYELSYIKQALHYTKSAFQNKEIFAIKMHIVQGLSLSLMLAVMLYFLINLRLKQMVTIGDFALILGLSVEVGFMTWWATEQVDELNKAIGKCKQSLSSLFVPLEIEDSKNAFDLVVTRGQIVFSNVRFHFKGTEPLFQNKSITIEAGQKVGLVGYSGGGKTTFASLILRLYDITDGQILIDGQDIRNVTQDSLHQAIGMIPQDPSLFHRTLMDNIRYGSVDASDAEVIKAAKRAHAHEFIKQLPQGYDSLVGERGVKLSGGQRQRIAIARAILKNAPILILDEATSQLDSVTENDIQESLWKLMQNKTTIIIAHRLSTLLHMDRILVFDHGKIVEDGNHAELLAKGGLYKTLWNAQTGGFLPDDKDEPALSTGG